MDIILTNITHFVHILSTITVSALTALLVAVINNKMQFFGGLRIYPTIIRYVKPEPLIENTTECKQIKIATAQKISSKYLVKCICFNSKSVPILIEDFHVEMTVQGSKEPVYIAVTKPEIDYTEFNGVKYGIYSPLEKQIIQPKALYEFILRLDIDDEIINCYPLILICYNEKHQRKEFIISKGVDLQKLNREIRQYFETIITNWHNKNTH